MKCTNCSEENEYAISNQPDGSFQCWKCRDAAKTKSAIPTNLDECFEALLRIAHPEDIETIKAGSEDDMCQYHHGIGTWIRNNWGLWHGGPLQDYFKQMGLWHADDMSGLILQSFWCYLKGIPLDVEGQVAHYLDYWKANGVKPPDEITV
ncbi:MAG TPA: DUF6794 domain-containing protein [Paenisporosarcina sp.]|nr:DUF6794 domain-containing protein [Paenisporosarcina sp.]